MRVIGIYKIISPSGKIYIGQSVDIKKRFWTYRRMHCKKQAKLFSSFISYGVSAHTFEVIIECEKDDLDRLEILYINHFNSIGENGLNLREGGNKGRLSIETKNKIKAAGKGNKNASGKRSEESLKNIREGQKNKRKPPEGTGKQISEGLKASKKHKETMASDEYRKKLSNALKGKKSVSFWKGKNRDPLTKEKISNSLTGLKASEETRQKMSNTRKIYWENKRKAS